MEDKKHEMRKISHCIFLKSDMQIVVKYIYSLKITSHTKETKILFVNVLDKK